MKFFRSTLEEHFLALTPELGYEHYGRQSTLARKYLKWLSKKYNVHIQTIESDNGEKKFGKWSLDGYIDRPENEGGPIAIEVFGWYAKIKINMNFMLIAVFGIHAAAVIQHCTNLIHWVVAM
jgi:hypothetical protein